MRISFSPKCLKSLKKIKEKDSKLFLKIKKQLVLFESSPDHPSLRLHKLSGIQSESWSISIDRQYRMLFYYQKSKHDRKVVFYAVGTHKDVYT